MSNESFETETIDVRTNMTQNSTFTNSSQTRNILPPQNTSRLVTLLEGESITIYNQTFTFQSTINNNRVLISHDKEQIILVQNESFELKDITLTLLFVSKDARIQPRRSFVDFSSRIFTVGGYRDTLSVGENRSFTIANKTYNVSLPFVGVDKNSRDSALFEVNGDVQSFNRREDRAIGGLYLFIHEIYLVREGASITKDQVIIKMNRNQ